MDNCIWAEDTDGNWNTSCGDMFIICEGDPTNNGMKYCCYCGKPIKEEYHLGSIYMLDEEEEEGDGVKRIEIGDAYLITEKAKYSAFMHPVGYMVKAFETVKPNKGDKYRRVIFAEAPDISDYTLEEVE